MNFIKFSATSLNFIKFSARQTAHAREPEAQPVPLCAFREALVAGGGGHRVHAEDALAMGAPNGGGRHHRGPRAAARRGAECLSERMNFIKFKHFA